MAKKNNRKKAGKKKTKNGIGKGAKIFLVFLGLFGLMLVFYVVFDAVNKALNASRSVNVAVDLEVGGSGDGPSQFKEPWGVATDSADNFYVADFGGQAVKKFTPGGEMVLSFGKSGKDPGEFNQPSGLYVAPQGDIYVCDTFNHRIQKFDSKGNLIKIWSHGFFGPRSIVGDNQNRIYVVDTGNHKIQVFDTDGNFLMEWGGFGTGDGKFREPVGVASDNGGFIYVADSDNLRIQKFDSNGKFVSAFKVSGWRGKNDESPYLALSQGYLYASNASSKVVLKYNLSGKLLAIFHKKDDKDGFSTATGVAADHQNRLYVVERGPGKVARFTIPPESAPAK